MVQENRDIRPDVIFFHEGASTGAKTGSRVSSGLTMERSAPVLLHVDQEEVSEAFIEGDAKVDLQSAFDRCYDEDHYDRSVRYESEPNFPLSDEDEF